MLNHNVNSADSQLANFIAKQELPVPKNLILDGRIHRFGEGEKGKEAHWYIGTQKGDKISLTIGSHKYPELKSTFKSQSNSNRNSKWSKGASLNEKWQSCQNVDFHPYLDRKNITGLFGAKVNFFGDLVIPMFSSISGELVGLQTINYEGKKLFVSGSRKKGSYFQIGSSLSEDASVFVTEGFATAVTVHMATGSNVICTFDCGNLPIVVQNLVNRYPKVKFIVAGDDDKFSTINSGRNAGKAVSNVATAIYPKFSSDYDHPTDWNDLFVREGIEEVKKQLLIAENIEDDKSSARKVGSEVVEMVSGKYLEDSVEVKKDEVLPSLIRGHVGILCSPGGYGKSGVSLLIANQIASGGTKDFLGFGPVAGGSVVILTLEDPIDIYSARHKVILKDFDEQEKKLVRENLHLIKALSVQNSVDSEKIITLIKDNYAENKRDISTLRLLVIDHLSYWSSLDLNDANSATVFMKEFRDLATRLNCAVLLLHHSNRTAMIKGKDRQSGSAAMGGSYKFHSLARWVAILEDSDDGTNSKADKNLILDKANYGKKFRLSLKSQVDRGGLLYRKDFNFTNLHLSQLPLDINGTEEIDSVPMDLVENFNLGEASPRLMNIDQNTHHIMNWLSRNPAFETVSPGKRKELTAIIDGREYDKDRQSASIYKDVWVSGDTLIVAGPVCDQEDMRLFALLVNELTRIHNDGAKGLILEISLSRILELSGLSDSGLNFDRVHRQLDRLRRMALDFKNSRSHRWRGPLINDVFTVGEGRNCRVRIGFNHFMVTFYRIQEYTLFQKSIAQALKGDSLSFYIFYASQTSRSMKISVEKCKNLLGILPSFDKKEAMKKIKKSIRDLVEAGVMDPNKTFVKDGFVHTSLASNSLA